MSDPLLHRLTLKIRQSLDLDEILNTTAVEVRQYLKTDRLLLYQFETPVKGRVVVESVDVAWPSLLDEVIEDPCFNNGWDEQYRQGRVGAISDIHDGSIQDCHAEMLAQFSVRANLVVPILQTIQKADADATQEQLWGLLIAHHCSEPRQWTVDEQETLQQLATHLAIALQQASQHRQLQAELQERQQAEAALRQSQQDYRALVATLEERIESRSLELTQQSQKASLFAEMALRIRQSLKLEDILQTMVHEVQTCLKVDRVLVYQVFDNGTGKTIAEAVLDSYPKILNMTFPEEVFPADYQERYRQGRVAALADVYSTEAPLSDCLVEFIEQWAVRAKLIVPILQSYYSSEEEETEGVPSELWGLLIAHQCEGPYQWSEFEIDLCRGLAEQFSIAIAQASFAESLEATVQHRTAQLTKSLKKTESLLASEETFRQLAENIQEVFFLNSVDFQKTFYISPAYESVLGRTCESLYQDPASWLSAIHPDDVANAQERMLYQQAHLDENVTVEYRVVRPDGDLRWILARLFPVREKDGKVLRIAGIAQDISLRKQAEESLQRSTISRSLVGDILRDIQDQARLSPTAMFQSGLALAQRLELSSLSEFLETFSLMGLGSLALTPDHSEIPASPSATSWNFTGNELVEVKTGSHSPTCHYSRGFLCGAIAKVTAMSQAEPESSNPYSQAAAVEMSCCSMGDDHCQFVVQLVE